MRIKGDKKNSILIPLIIILAAIVCFAVFLFFINRGEREARIKRETAPLQKTGKILTPEEKKQELLEYLRKKEEAISPEELAREKAKAEQKRQELLEYLKKKEEAEKIKQQ